MIRLYEYITRDIRRRTVQYNVNVLPLQEGLVQVSVALRRPQFAKYLFGIFLKKSVITNVIELNIAKDAALVDVKYTGPIMKMTIQFKSQLTEKNLVKTADVFEQIVKIGLTAEQQAMRLAKI